MPSISRHSRARKKKMTSKMPIAESSKNADCRLMPSFMLSKMPSTKFARKMPRNRDIWQNPGSSGILLFFSAWHCRDYCTRRFNGIFFAPFFDKLSYQVQMVNLKIYLLLCICTSSFIRLYGELKCAETRKRRCTSTDLPQKNGSESFI